MLIRPFRRIRESFQAKLQVALLGTGALILLGTLLAVLGQTSVQVQETVERARDRSRGAFAQLEELRRVQLGLLGEAFTDSRRTVALLEAALDDGDRDYLVQQIRYELDLRRVQRSLTVFTDSRGDPVVTILNGGVLEGVDPSGIGELATLLLEEGDSEFVSYRVVDGVLHNIRVLPLVLVGRPIGTVTFGLPLDDEVAEALGNVAGAEACLLSHGRCLAGSAGAMSFLSAAMTGSGAGLMEGSWEAKVDGERWTFVAEVVENAGPEGIWRVLAVPLDPALAPFDRILLALLITGGLALVLAFGVSLFLARGLTRPVEAMVAATRRVAVGDYEARVQVNTRDELSVLADAFNEMTIGLQLKEQYRGVLDKVVSPDVARELMSGDVILGGENRKVTVLFADICDFTSLTEGKEPQAVIGLLNECMKILSCAVEETGGIVDKFVGDEIMAVFGAPLAQEDQALRAVVAGMRMQEGLKELNRAREGRGEEPLSIRVGVNTGLAVAGNMGSDNRLNYTVLGDSVNLAARLCAAAEPGEVLLSGGTQEELGKGLETEAAGSRDFKGFSHPIPVFRPIGAWRPSFEKVRGSLSLLLLGLALFPGGLTAQRRDGGLPTLREMGLGYLSPGGAIQLDLSGRVELESYLPGGDPPYLIPTADPFLAPRAELFVDLFLGDHLYLFGELQADRGEEPSNGDYEGRMDQLFLRVSPFPDIGLAFQLGKFSAPFGGYAARRHSLSEPFIRAPMAYEHRTVICPFLAPSTAARFLSWRDAPDTFRPRGAPPIWGVPYLWGGMALVSKGPVSFQGAVMNGVVSSEPEFWGLKEGRFDVPTYMAALSVAITQGLRMSGWYHQGPYLIDEMAGALPGYSGLTDYVQEIIGGEAEYKRGRLVLRGEAFWDRWEVPNVPDDPIDISYSLEGIYRFSPGWSAGLRFSGVQFNELRALDGSGTPAPRIQWDYDIRRYQGALSYRIAANTGIRGEAAFNSSEGPLDPDDNLFSLQWWWAF